MSDAAVVGLSTSAVGIVSIIFTWLSARRTAAVELERIRSDAEREREHYREEERRNRQGTYHRLLAVLDRLDTFATGYAPSGPQFLDTMHEFNSLHGGVLLFGDSAVKDAMGPITEALGKVGAGMDEGDKLGSFVRSYGAHRREVVEATAKLVAVMSQDVQRGIFDP